MPPDSDAEAKQEDDARAKKDAAESKESLRPAPEKTPEGERNLRRRADWFQKRTGGSN